MIIFVHLLNDNTGSPRVLKNVIEAILDHKPATLFVGTDGDGILNDVPVNREKYWYKRSRFRLITFFSIFISQFILFCRLFLTYGFFKKSTIYVNTLLPFGAAIFGYVTRRPVIYHVHEVSLSPKIFRIFLTKIAEITATRLIYVSHAHAQLIPIAPTRSVIVHNQVDASISAVSERSKYRHRQNGLFRVLMLASAKIYKGIEEFVRLADSLNHRTDIVFDLVLSDLTEQLPWSQLPPNTTLHPPTKHPQQHYENASVVLNLSRPDLWIETFGLTLIEGMSYGVPVIAPPIGGPPELITHGQEGFLIDSRDGGTLKAALVQMADSEELCFQMSAAARKRASYFGRETFQSKIFDIVASVHG